jgi:hypothetical protein
VPAALEFDAYGPERTRVPRRRMGGEDDVELLGMAAHCSRLAT